MIVYETAPAKINLSLNVLGKREDGYHEVEMVMTTIDLIDRITIYRLTNDEIKVSLENRYVPNDERNLAYQAAYTLKKRYNISEGVHIEIDKNIPVSAGLGGGSSNAAAVLRGLNRLWSLHLSLEELADIGSSIGSDVPFCIYSKTAIARGRGELIEILPSLPPCWVVLAKPNIGVSTREIFTSLRINHHLTHPQTEDVIHALYHENIEQLYRAMGNSLEQITFALYPEVQKMKWKMTELGSPFPIMSGSGPTLYSLIRQENKAKRIYNSLSGFCDEVYMVRTLG